MQKSLRLDNRGMRANAQDSQREWQKSVVYIRHVKLFWCESGG